ncbi:hypothetical protein ABPG75_006580 [Micractinium tetrahymenae]
MPALAELCAAPELPAGPAAWAAAGGGSSACCAGVPPDRQCSCQLESASSVLQGHALSISSSSSSLPDLAVEEAAELTWRPTDADFAAAHGRPVLLAANPALPYQRISGADRRNLPFNDGSPIEIETPLFSGRACVWLRGAPGGPAADAQFAGRRRRSLVTVQGRFRVPVPLDDLVTGQEFGRVENLPPAWLVEGVLLKIARAVSPSMVIGPASAPFMLMPVISGCSEIHAARPGEEPHPAEAPREDLRAWDPSLCIADGSPLPAAKRKAHFSRPAARAGRAFPTDLVFTFYFYQHVVDISAYQLDVLYKFDLTKYLVGQPLQLMMRLRSTGEFAYCLHLYHERLLAKSGGKAK